MAIESGNQQETAEEGTVFTTSVVPASNTYPSKHFVWAEISPLFGGRARSKRESVSASWSFVSVCSARDPQTSERRPSFTQTEHMGGNIFSEPGAVHENM